MESTFLGEVAADLFGRYGSEVGELKVLFPSRRGRIFFSDALSQLATEPIWEPEWISIDEMMSRISGVEVGEHIRLIAELFRVYKRYHTKETFDRFYYWGEVLLADFDMVDKYMIDAEDLFRNVSDIKELETDLSYLSPEQSKIVAFWSSIYDADGGDLSIYKERFLVVWRSLLPIYKEYREVLQRQGIAYSGMVHRIAAERIRSGEVDVVSEGERYVIAGFNALSECEKVLFGAIKSGATAHFYWDWDRYYSLNSRQEAGLFINTNKDRFPAALETSHDNFSSDKRIEAVACSSAVLQCKYVAKILEDILQRDKVVDKRTAIVLTDESLLLPLLYSLPEGIGRVNVTMGYPLKQTLAYSFIERLLELQQHARVGQGGVEESFYHVDVVGLISHPYLAAGVEESLLRSVEREIDRERLITLPAGRLHRSGLLKKLFRVTRGWRERSEYLVDILRSVASLPMSDGDNEEAGMRVEFLSFLIDNIIKLQLSIEECGIEFETSTYVSLLRRHLQPLRIPFEGEPLEGVQVMGILETRTLDFDNVILLSMSDDNFPGSRALQPSYIPYGLRSHFELPTPEHHDGVYAYYFYRLIQRAQNVHMLYCSRADDKSTGEQSRYITQLELESPFNVERVDVGVDVNLFGSESIEVEKTESVMRRLREFCEEHEVVKDGVASREIRLLSPTALFQYVACPLRFYYRSIAKIRPDDELSEQVDAPMFGNILHDAMQRLYKPIKVLRGVEAVVEALQAITRCDVEREVDLAIRTNFLRDENSVEELSGNLTLVREVVINYILRGVLRYDIANPPKQILGVESDVEIFVDLDAERRVRLGGVCDRVDLMSDGSLRIVDYKTGSSHLDFAGVDGLFYGEAKDRQSNIFQTLLYSYILRQDGESGAIRKVTPSLYYVRSMGGDDYSPLLCNKGDKSVRGGAALEEYEPLHNEFDEALRELLTELFDESQPFKQCENIESCDYCDFAKICRRN
ncbi:MAG: PD-(D/E)XK nuclease family protein [Rikenellaceae bacterium]